MRFRLTDLTLQRLFRRLGYTFKDQDLIKQALTHCSAGTINYERLEFLGDSILSFVIATKLYSFFPEISEGQLSRLRSFLVKGDTLAEIAAEIELGDCLYLGQGELKSGGFRRASILADALEAIFAAVYLDGGIEAVEQVILDLFKSRLDDPNLCQNLKDAKTQLQEHLQASKYALPNYTLSKVEGEEHNQVFFITCTVSELSLESDGKGPSRRKAEQNAAKVMLNKLRTRKI